MLLNFRLELELNNLRHYFLPDHLTVYKYSPNEWHFSCYSVGLKDPAWWGPTVLSCTRTLLVGISLAGWLWCDVNAWRT